MTDKLMYIPNDDFKNFSFYRLQLVVESLDNQLNESTNQNSIEVLKVVKPTNKKRLLENFGD